MDQADEPIAIGEIIQIVPTHRWGGCLAVVSEVKRFGAVAYVNIPSHDGAAWGQAYIRLQQPDFARVGALAVFVPGGK